MITIPTSIVKRVPYVGPVGAAKIIAGRLINECTPPELLIGGKCVMLAGGIVASVATGGNTLVVSGTISAARSILRG